MEDLPKKYAANIYKMQKYKFNILQLLLLKMYNLSRKSLDKTEKRKTESIRRLTFIKYLYKMLSETRAKAFVI